MQVVFLFCAVAAGIAAGFGVDRYVSALPAAWLAGALVFVTGLLLQECVLRRRSETRTLRRLAMLHRLYATTREDVTGIEAELQTLREAAEGGAPAGIPTAPVEVADAPEIRAAGSGRDTAALTAEAKVLSGLVRQIDAAAADRRDRGSSATSQSGELSETVRAALRQNRQELFLRPIVALPQRKRRYYQCAIHLHGRDGETLPPERYAAAARAAGLGAAVDKMLLFRAVQLIRSLPLDGSGAAFFCGVSPDSFADERFLADFVSYLGSGEDISSHLVFEIRDSDRIKFDSGAALELESLVRAGYRLCLAGPEDFDLDVPRLTEQGFRFLKIDARRLMPATRSDPEANRVHRLKQGLDRAGVGLIVDNIASEQMLVELLDFDIDFGAGLLFGEPRQAGGEVEPAMAGEPQSV